MLHAVRIERHRVRKWLAVLVALAGLGALVRLAPAQVQPVLLADVGHGGAIRPGAYFPIRITVDWIIEPDAEYSTEPEAARISVRLPQDSIYAVRIERDLTIQRGQRSTTVVYARSQASVDAIEFELRGGGGRLLARGKAHSGDLSGWAPVADHEAIVLVAGKSSLPRSGWVFDHQNLSPVSVAEVEPGALPREWPGYDGVSVVVLGDLGTDRLDALQVRTLREWVRWGGHLALSVTNQTDTYRQVLGDLQWPLIFGEYNSFEFDAGLSDVLARCMMMALDPDALAAHPSPKRWNPFAAPEARSRISENSSMAWYEQHMAQVRTEIEQFSGRYLYRRPIELLSEAVAEGWRARWSTDSWDPATKPSAGPISVSGDIAWGPFGLGTITLLGTDPAALAGGSARELRGVGWAHALAHVRPLHRASSFVLDAQQSYYASYSNSEDLELANAAANDLLDELSVGFGVGHGLFGAISVALLLLALLIGPIDYLFLRWLRREPLTWLTCPLLILLASGAIYFAQESVSYGRARATRVAVVDAWSGSTQGRGTSFTAFAAARGGRYTLGPPREDVYMSPTCWHPPSWYYGDEAAATTVPIEQHSLGSSVVSMYVPLENVRWMLDRGPIEVPQIDGLIRYDAARDRLWLDLNVPAGVEGSIEAVWWNDGWYTAGAVGRDLSVGPLVRQPFLRDREQQERVNRRRDRANLDPWVYPSRVGVEDWMHDAAFQVTGRREVGERLTDLSPAYGAVLLRLNDRSDVELMRGDEIVETEWEERMMLRLIVPARRGGEADEEIEP